jgi:outer membrane protein TolC
VASDSFVARRVEQLRPFLQLDDCRVDIPQAPAWTSAVLAVAAIGAIASCRSAPEAVQSPPFSSKSVDVAASNAETAPAPRCESPIQLAQHAASNEIAQPDRTDSQPSESIPTPVPSDVAAEPLPVEHFVSVALSNHPRIRAARARVAAASQRAPQVRSLDDPVLANNFYPISDQSLQTAAGRAGNSMSISQKYPWPEKRRTRAAIADRETQMAVARLDQVELEIEEMVRLAYYELWFADQSIKITQRNRDVAVELITLAKARHRAGGSQQDVLRAQLQVDALDDRLIGLAQQKALVQADLAALIQDPGRRDVEPTEKINLVPVPENLDALFVAAGECSPRLRELRWAVARDRQKQQLAGLNRYPDFTLGAGWQTMTESDAISPVANGRDNVSLMVGVTLPVWRERINASIREASAEVSASNRDYGAARDDTFRQIRRLSEQVYAAEEQLRLYHERVLPRAKQALHLASADYRGRLVDFGEVADGFTEVLMFELQVARAETTLAGTIAQLHRAVGCEVLVAE